MVIKLRCVGVVKKEYEGTLLVTVDSSVWRYSGDRSGSLSKMDNLWGWDVDEHVSYVRCCEPERMRPDEKTEFIHNADGKAVSKVLSFYTSKGEWVPSTRCLYTYGEHVITSLDQEYGDSLKWTDGGRTQYTYAAAEKPAIILRQHRDKWGGMVWKDGQRETFTYDGDGNLLSYVTDISGADGWGPQYRTTYTYDMEGNRIAALSEEFMYNKWGVASRATYSDFVAGQPRTIITQSRTGHRNRVNINYNSYGRPDVYFTEHWNDSTNAWETGEGDMVIHLYYEVYTGLGDMAGVANELEISPVPANRTINLKINWIEAQEATISIADMQGKIYRNWGLPVMHAYNEVVPIEDLPAGNYIVTVAGAKNTISRKLTVVK